MNHPISTVRVMPDASTDADAAVAGALDWVGMRGIDLPVVLGAGTPRSAARVAAHVNLHRADARGIHMSRLYLHLVRALAGEPVTPAMLRRTLEGFLETHRDLSDRAMLRIELEQLVPRPALVSAHEGWKAYPVSITGTLDGGRFALELGFRVLYSSTCPGSAALARQLIQQRFAADFPRDGALAHDAVLGWLGTAQGICATPHAQRSTAEVRARLVASLAELPLVELIDLVEAALATPVQTAVKREDEQAFARLNGENPMFCEDAARRIGAALDRDARITDFRVRTVHHESLHAHDAVAVATKGVPGGYDARGHDPD